MGFNEPAGGTLRDRIAEPIQHLDSDWDIACDYDCPDGLGATFPWGHGAAEWVLHMRCGECGKSGHRLACQTCKDNLLQTHEAVSCGFCDAVASPARRIFVSIRRFK